MPSSRRLFVVHIPPRLYIHSPPLYASIFYLLPHSEPNYPSLRTFQDRHSPVPGSPVTTAFVLSIFYSSPYHILFLVCSFFLPFPVPMIMVCLHRAPMFFGLITIRAYSCPLYSEYSIGTLTIRFYFLLSFALFRVLSSHVP